MTEHDIVIDGEGNVRFVYSDDLVELFQGETVKTTRASHVEPHPDGDGWLADMRPSGGPILALNGEADAESPLLSLLKPFPTRQAALDAEREWLRKEKGL